MNNSTFIARNKTVIGDILDVIDNSILAETDETIAQRSGVTVATVENNWRNLGKGLPEAAFHLLISFAYEGKLNLFISGSSSKTRKFIEDYLSCSSYFIENGVTFSSYFKQHKITNYEWDFIWKKLNPQKTKGASERGFTDALMDAHLSFKNYVINNILRIKNHRAGCKNVRVVLPNDVELTVPVDWVSGLF